MDQRKQQYLITSTIPFLIVLLCLANKTLASSQSNKKHFVLVHGSCHGAWSWYKIVTLIRSSGHDATALDLAASGIDPQQANDLHSISDYFKPLRDFMAALPPHEGVILVGHSLGGLAVSQAMERFPSKISVAVFVTGLMPGPNLNISTLQQEAFRRQESQLDSRFTYDQGPDNPPTTFIFGPLYLATNVYQLSPKEDVELATMLIRPLRLFNGDLVQKRDFQLWMIERNRPNRVIEIRGSDHMVMMSKPLELWEHLQKIAANYS
ncbi:hypothetical protein M0R45_007895 [Rubus argutus]|uniref:AB hydrolase-1 domain-containing protein n=1 Tax=Rubus argutus TaxID=59490 RepID=A0AAW1XZZ1_RUBAR